MYIHIMFIIHATWFLVHPNSLYSETFHPFIYISCLFSSKGNILALVRRWTNGSELNGFRMEGEWVSPLKLLTRSEFLTAGKIPGNPTGSYASTLTPSLSLCASIVDISTISLSLSLSLSVLLLQINLFLLSKTPLFRFLSLCNCRPNHPPPNLA